jgi:Dictyostelium (slime mold) repeat
VCNGDETCDGAGNCVGGMPLDCDDGNLCTPDSCEPVGGCVHGTSPFAGCRTALRSTLHLKSDADDANDTLVWKWAKGQTTAQADFGVPSATTKSALCIYTIYIGSTPTLVAEYDVPADAVKWSAISTKGYKYTDPAGGADGIRKMVLKGGTQNKSKCVVKGKGSGLNDLDLLTLFDPLIVQLVNSSTPACFESTFTQADFVIFNDSAEFKAKAH